MIDRKLTKLQFLSGTALTLIWALAGAAPAKAADLFADATGKPAVDAFNGKIEGFGGWADQRYGSGDFSGGGLGSVTFPIGQSFGFQLDGMAGVKDSDFVGGGAAHLFTRNPDTFLLGVYGSGVGFDNSANSWNAKIGGEGEAYLGRFTVSGVLGYERLGGDSNGFERSRKGGSFFDYVDVGYYLTDNLKLSVGHRYTGRKHAAAFGAEALLPVAAAPVSAFVEGRYGENDYKAVWAGLKVYFGGESATLIARQRESDPTNWLKDDMFSTSVKRRSTSGAVTPPPPPPPNPCGCGPCGYD